MTALAYPARFARLVKFEHTVFALPFAYVGAFLAVNGTPSAHDLLWITVAMVGARSLAMALNRLIDAGIDARNPRTAGREIPSGQLSATQVWLFCAASLALFLIAVWQLNPVVRWLWPIPVIGFVVYPYLKRFTWLCHPLPLTHLAVELEVGEGSVEIVASAETQAQTGVEMEALVAATVAALTVYDMAKGVDSGMEIGEVRLLEKGKE